MTNSIEIKNSYKILGLDISASKEDAKKAYRKLAKRFHPDKNSESNASDFFRIIHKAHECIQKATDEEIIRCRSEETIPYLHQAAPRPIEIGIYDLLQFELHSDYQPSIVRQPPDAGGSMTILENQRIIQMVNVLGSPINLLGTFQLQDPGFILIENNTVKNGYLSKAIYDGYYTWNGQNLTLSIGVTATPTGPYPGERCIIRGIWHKR